MKKIFSNDYFLFSILYVLLAYVTVLQSTVQDFTSIIDFDLTVIHNSLQLVSNKFPDFQDLTAYSHFLTYGIFYKIFGLFDKNLITNIDLLISDDNPEIILQDLYVISRLVNSTLHFIILIFFYNFLQFFKIDRYYKVLTIFFIIFTETFIANFIILRTDIVAVCYFILSTYFLFSFIKNTKIYYLYFVSFFMVLSLLAKVQIIFLYMFIFIFFFFYCLWEKDNKIKDFSVLLLNLKLIKSKYILTFFLLLYFIFQIYLNHFVNSSSGVGYLDFLCFAVYFLIFFLLIEYLCKLKGVSKTFIYDIFTLIILFSITSVIFLKLLDIFNFIKFDFRIIFSLTNPFYFLKIYSPFGNNELSSSLIIDMLLVLFKDLKFNLIYLITIIFILFYVSINSLILKRNKIFIPENIYIFLLLTIILFMSSLNNVRYNISYDVYFILFYFLLLAIFFKSIVADYKIFSCAIITITMIFNFVINIDNYNKYIFKSSKLEYVCVNKNTREFYYQWANNFDENFFKKICYNKNLSFK